ncbi:efflux transporter outer membrane subunit [Brevundimonas sp. CEF1]|uniref:efflux transporter outer membrane subunit n=1 Tax=Brevundimonas sp. CEF1 TaxID=3442642 RepID=UPI003F517BE0
MAGPNYAPEPAAAPSAFRYAAASEAAGPIGEWWSAFGDSQLDGLIARALTGNLDLAQSEARIRQARAQEAVVRGGAGPTLNASAQAGYNQLSDNALPSALSGLGGGSTGGETAGGIGLPGEGFANYQIGFDASWELDLFGGQQRAEQAAIARIEAAVWSARDVQVRLAAEVANSYFQYRALQRRLMLSDLQIAAEQEHGETVAARVRNGLSSTLDQSRQTVSKEQLIAARTELAAQRDTRRLALETLLGLHPGALEAELAETSTAYPMLVPVPAGLPSELLQRRPDLRAAERRAAAASADIGVATADLYPKLSLTGVLQLASRELSTLLESDSLVANGAGRLSLPLVDGGARRATVDLRRAQAEEAELAYRSTIQTALREVEEALRRLDADRRRVTQLQAAAAAARDAADTSQARYRSGVVALDEVLDARKAAASVEDAVAQAQAAAAQDMIAIYKALGGGWDERRVALFGEGIDAANR